MAQNAKGKKKDPLEHLELLPVSNLKISQSEDGKVKVRGAAGYETIFLKKPIQEGMYYLEIEVLSSKDRKKKQKGCSRLGVYCHTEEMDVATKPVVYSLGSTPHSIAYRVKDRSVLKAGKAIFRPQQSKLEMQLAESDSDSESDSEEQSVNYSILLGIVDPKNPQLIKYFKNKLDPVELTMSSNSFIAFFKNGVFECGFKGLREGVYHIGVSLFNEAQVNIDLEGESRLESLKEQLLQQQSNMEVATEQPELDEGQSFLTAGELYQMIHKTPINSLRHLLLQEPVLKQSQRALQGVGPELVHS